MSELTRFLPSWVDFLLIPGLVIGFTAHEMAHACVAYWLGDTSQLEQRRISLNPLRHIFWLGMLTFVLFGFGWSKPVKMDLGRFRNRYWGLLIVSLSGAVANVTLAAVCVLITLTIAVTVAFFSDKELLQVLGLLTWEPASEPAIAAVAAALTGQVIYANLALAFFNLLPLPGLDGFNVLAGLYGVARGTPASSTVPEEQRSGKWAGIKKATGQVGKQLADIHFERGAAYHAEGLYEDAIARYRQAIANDPHYGPAYVNLGLAYLATGQRDRALQCFRGAIRLAADEQSRQQAWQQLYKLSQYYPNASPTQAPSSLDLDVLWRKTELTFDWRSFRVAIALLFSVMMCVYVGLTLMLILQLP